MSNRGVLYLDIHKHCMLVSGCPQKLSSERILLEACVIKIPSYDFFSLFGKMTMTVPKATNTFPTNPRNPGNTPTPTTQANADATTGSINVATEMAKLSKYIVDRRYPMDPLVSLLPLREEWD